LFFIRVPKNTVFYKKQKAFDGFCEKIKKRANIDYLLILIRKIALNCYDILSFGCKVLQIFSFSCLLQKAYSKGILKFY